MKRTLLLVLAGLGLAAFTPTSAKADRIDLGPITIYRHHKHHHFDRDDAYRRRPYSYEDERRREWRERHWRERDEGYHHYPRDYDEY